MSQSSSKTRKPSVEAGLKTSSRRKSSAYDRNFEQNLIDHGIYPNGYNYPDGRTVPLPNNWEQINKRLMRPRPSLSLSRFNDDDFRDFIRAGRQVIKEEDVMASVFPIIAGKTKSHETVARGVKFGNLDP